VLDRRWLTTDGPLVQEFEQRLSDYLGVTHCVAICNGTMALELTTRALGLSGEVIVPAFAFVAIPHSLEWQGITPVFCDIDPRTYTIDPEKIEALITPRTTGVIGVHLASMSPFLTGTTLGLAAYSRSRVPESHTRLSRA
jgi:dTDP-4-amino-4,6-dideoxygalactose transaminase